MKTLYKFIGLFIISSFLIFTACEDTDQSYTGDPFIYFSDDVITVPESSSDIVSLSVLLADAPAKSDITVSIDVQLTAAGVTQELVEGVDFEVISPDDLSSITIPVGENSADIQIALFDNVVEDSAKYIALTLTNAGNYVLGYPGSEAKKSCVITITDDDCAFLAENWQGQPTGVEFFPDIEFDAATVYTLISDDGFVATYGVTGMMSGILDYWNTNYGEVILESWPAILTVDYSNPANVIPSLGSAEQFLYHTDDGSDEYYYYVNDDPAKDNSVSVCEYYMEVYYIMTGYYGSSSFSRNCYLKVTFDPGAKSLKVLGNYEKLSK